MAKNTQNKKPPRITEKEEAKVDPADEYDSSKVLGEKAGNLCSALFDMIVVPRVLLLALVSLVILLPTAFFVHRSAINQSCAQYAYEHQDWSAAIEYFERLGFDDKLAVQGASSIVHAYVENEQYDMALQRGDDLFVELTTRLAQSPLEPEKMKNLKNEQLRLLGFLSWAMLEAGREEDARQAASQIIEVRPGEPVANITMGRIAIKNSDLEKARQHYEIVAQSREFREYYKEFDKLVKP